MERHTFLATNGSLPVIRLNMDWTQAATGGMHGMDMMDMGTGRCGQACSSGGFGRKTVRINLAQHFKRIYMFIATFSSMKALA